MRVKTKKHPFGAEIKRSYEDLKKLYEDVEECELYKNSNLQMTRFPDEQLNQSALKKSEDRSLLHKVINKILEEMLRIVGIEDLQFFDAFSQPQKKNFVWEEKKHYLDLIGFLFFF